MLLSWFVLAAVHQQQTNQPWQRELWRCLRVIFTFLTKVSVLMQTQIWPQSNTWRLWSAAVMLSLHHFCLSVFRFPLKLAISSFVTCVAIYHVSLNSLITYIIVSELGHFTLMSASPSGCTLVSCPGRPHSAHCSCWHWWKYRLLVAWLRDRPFRRQDGGCQNCDFLHLVAWRYVGSTCCPSNKTPVFFLRETNAVFLLDHAVSMLPLCDDPVLFGQPCYAHEVHGSPQVCAVRPQRQHWSKENAFSLSKVYLFWVMIIAWNNPQLLSDV